MNIDEAHSELLLLYRGDKDCYTVRASNESGTLWERLWKYEEGHFQTIVCARGLFPTRWTRFVGIDEAAEALAENYNHAAEISLDEHNNIM